MAASSREPGQAAMECTVCLLPFTDPRMLPCVHTFCRECLQTCMDGTDGGGGGGSFNCPVCGVQCQVTVPSQGAEGFPSNVYVRDLTELITRMRVQQKGAALPELRSVRTFSVDHSSWVSGICRIYDYLCVAHIDTCQLSLYGLHGLLVKTLELTGCTPCGMAVTSSEQGKLVVADEGPVKRLHWLVFNKDLNVTSQNTFQVGYHPLEVSADLKGLVTVTARDPNQIIVYNEEAEQVKLLTLPSAGLSSLFVAVNLGETFNVVDRKNNCVMGISASGRELFTWKQQDDTMKKPGHVMWHPHGFLMVADTGNHRLQAINQEGYFMKYFHMEGARDWIICSMHWDAIYRHLYVTQSPRSPGDVEAKVDVFELCD